MTENSQPPLDGSTASDTRGPGQIRPEGVASRRAGPELRDGTSIGRYVLLGKVGSGGMGVVYAAYDRQLDRKVALKFVGAEEAESRLVHMHERLLAEAHALAKLTHPNVVRIYDVGTYEDRVYLSMEYIEGQTLRDWLAEQPRRWPEILRLMLEAGRGLAAAHTANIIHRDLKPSNIMIARDGQVRIMDFGLACAAPDAVDRTRHEADDRITLDDTGSSGRLPKPLVGTPGYMSPEQWNRQETTACADQFAYCVTIWEALYNQRPFDEQTKDALWAATRRPPPKGRQVPGWLRRLLERGLATEPMHRWPSMAALLTGMERGRTRARMNIGGMVLFGVAAVVAGVYGYQRWDHQRDLHQRTSACDEAGSVIHTLWNNDTRRQIHDAFAASGASDAETVASKVMPWLDDYTAAWHQARTDVCLNGDPIVRGVWNDELTERAVWCLNARKGTVEWLVDEFGRADVATVDKAIVAASTLESLADCTDEDVLRTKPMPPIEHRQLIEEITNDIAHAYVLTNAGKTQEALALVTQNHERAKVWPPVWASVRTWEGELLSKLGEYEKAEAASKDAYIEALRAGMWQVATNSAIDLIYIIGYRRARHEEGRMWARLADATIVHAADRSALWKGRRLKFLSGVEEASGDYAKAKTLSEQSLLLYEEALGPHHPLVAAALNALGNAHMNLGEVAQAQTLYERSLAINEAALGREHPSVAENLNNLAKVYARSGSLPEAKAMFERALTVQERTLGREHPDVALILSNVAVLHHMMGAPADAVPLHTRALAIYEKALGPEHPDLTRTLGGLANAYTDIKEYEKAQELYARALAIREKALGPKHPGVATLLSNLGGLLIQKGKPRDAVPMLQRAVDIIDAQDGVQPGKFETHFELARALVLAKGDRARAIAHARTAREGLRAGGPGSAKVLAEVEAWLLAQGVK